MQIPKRQAWRSKAKSKEKAPSARTVGLLHARSGGVCEICGQAEATEIHHRKYRSRGGGHNIENLLNVCGMGNTSGCHGRCHTQDGEDNGWAVHAWQDERTVPVTLRDGEYLLDRWGGKSDQTVEF